MKKTREWWELDDPSDVLGQVIRASRAGVGDVVVARVSNDGQVKGTRTLTVPEEPVRRRTTWDDQRTRDRYRSELSKVVRAAAVELAPPHEWRADGRAGMTGVFITVVFRDGRVVDTDAEWRWLYAWRYANHFRDGFDGDVYVVTPYGWTGVMDARAGFEPAMARRGGPRALRAV